MRRVAAVTAAMLLSLAVLTGCGASIPADPDGALDRIDGGVLRVGASPSDGLVVLDDPSGADPVSGPLPDLIAGFAAGRDARARWTVGSEEDLVAALESGALDVAIGGMTDDTPWSDRVSVTRGYTGIPGAAGRPVVVLLPLGENGLQSALEAYLDAEVGP